MGGLVTPALAFDGLAKAAGDDSVAVEYAVDFEAPDGVLDMDPAGGGCVVTSPGGRPGSGLNWPVGAMSVSVGWVCVQGSAIQHHGAA